jgi:glycerate kinase
VIEMAAASGLALVPQERRNPMLTTTFGTGELIRGAIDAGVRRIIIGIGGSATTDGGAATAQAVGVRFLDDSGQVIDRPLSGGQLERVARIDLSARHPAIEAAHIDVACDVTNPLCGPNGAAAVYGPQKGANPEQVQVLDQQLAHLADVILRDLGINVRHIPGAGAAGGLGAGLVAFVGARLRRGIELVMDAVRFHERIHGADLIITGEGRLDAQSMMGKAIAGVGAAAREAGVPVVALVGTVGGGAERAMEVLESYHTIAPAGISKEQALRRAPEFLRNAAAQLMRDRYGIAMS